MVALLLALGGGLAMFALIAALSVPLQRWADRSGAYEGKRQAPLGKQLQLIAFICVTTSLGVGLIYVGRVDGPRWLVIPGFLLFMAMIVGAAYFGSKLGRSARPRPASHGPRPKGFFGRRLPPVSFTAGRAFGVALGVAVGGIVALLRGQTVYGAAAIAVGLIGFVVLVRLLPKRRGPSPSS
jgi:hypothetical protein